ncbi:proteasome subunit y, putative [Ichthyophthirius multifiliis]|uniref:Proteasome subunit beta n=1 Tax=Ichthyophthirius multifiliis TaxID=5932 RepID=G0QU40_ICHMU|nr:proteasome subunit y, putative [Ichthyophthirius multifiliis]EGR31264.1 proteasome subunit y, putative [Ichthyophthirius multifiliis]|eukprot:XP_004034750.1 proteasome subunit y, putative [Ichthyophthirius multifiliis]
MFQQPQADILAMPDSQDFMNNQQITTGTTIMAVVYDGGVLIGADSRTSSGQYIVDRVADKLDYVHDRIFCLRSGSAADTQTLCTYVRYYIDVHTVESGRRPAVKTAAKLFQNMIYEYKDNLSAAVIVAGVDDLLGPQIYNVNPNGSIFKQQCATGGSGSGYIYGFVDSNFKENMSLDEAKKFIKQAISLSMSRDGSSGGIMRLMNITKEKVEREFVDLKDLPYRLY